MYDLGAGKDFLNRIQKAQIIKTTETFDYMKVKDKFYQATIKPVKTQAINLNICNIEHWKGISIYII